MVSVLDLAAQPDSVKALTPFGFLNGFTGRIVGESIVLQSMKLVEKNDFL